MEAFLLILFIFAMGVYYYSRTPGFIGTWGEKRVSKSLEAAFSSEHYEIFSDLILPTDRGTTQIDHLVLSRYGVFVIETKNMSGWIFGSEDRASWTQVIRKQKHTFQNPLRQNYYHVKVVQGVLNVDIRKIFNLVAFVGEATPKTAMPPNVFWSTSALVDFIEFRKLEMISEAQLQDFSDRVKNAKIAVSRKVRRAHVQQVRKVSNERNRDLAKCPRCSSKMVERTNRNTGDKFMGCTRYPRCRGTRPIRD